MIDFQLTSTGLTVITDGRGAVVVIAALAVVLVLVYALGVVVGSASTSRRANVARPPANP